MAVGGTEPPPRPYTAKHSPDTRSQTHYGNSPKGCDKPAEEECLFSSSLIFLRAQPLGEIGLEGATVGGQAQLRSPRKMGWHWAAPAPHRGLTGSPGWAAATKPHSQVTRHSPSRERACCNLSIDSLGCDTSGVLSLSWHLRLVLSDATTVALTQDSGLHPANPKAGTQKQGQI